MTAICLFPSFTPSTYRDLLWSDNHCCVLSFNTNGCETSLVDGFEGILCTDRHTDRQTDDRHMTSVHTDTATATVPSHLCSASMYHTAIATDVQHHRWMTNAKSHDRRGWAQLFLHLPGESSSYTTSACRYREDSHSSSLCLLRSIAVCSAELPSLTPWVWVTWWFLKLSCLPFSHLGETVLCFTFN